MAIDRDWVDRVRALPDLASLKEIEIDGLRLKLPVGGKRKRGITWQRRGSDDVLPDSPVADAPEKTPSQLLHALTEPVTCDRTLADVLSGDLAPLAPLFLFETKGKRAIPVAFHVLATKAAGKPKIGSRAFTHKTFMLLMRNADGRLDIDLVRDFVEAFRSKPSELDLAQQTVLEALQPGWDPSTQHDMVELDLHGPEPFVPAAGELLRRDLRRLIDARLSSGDFFLYVNRLLALHFGLYQPRLAAALNPAMRLLEQELAQPGTVKAEDLERIERGQDPRHKFEGSILAQAPTGGEWRPMPNNSPPLLAHRRLARALTELHFSLPILNRIREIAATWLVQKRGYPADSAAATVRYPSQILSKVQQDDELRAFFARASEAFCARFIEDQILESSGEAALEDVYAAPHGLTALFELYRRYNREAAGKRSDTRSFKAGDGVIRRLLGAGESGLLRTRKGVGAYFEVGPGLLPLLLLTSIPTGHEKIAVHRFWPELAKYGVFLEHEEQERLLLRLKAMGLYERYSDAGQASYVRSILAATEEGA